MARGVIFEVAVRRRHVRFSSLNGITGYRTQSEKCQKATIWLTSHKKTDAVHRSAYFLRR